MQLAKFSGLTLGVQIDADMQQHFLGSAPIHQTAKKAGVDSTFYPMVGLTHNSTVFNNKCSSCIPSFMEFIKTKTLP